MCLGTADVGAEPLSIACSLSAGIASYSCLPPKFSRQRLNFTQLRKHIVNCCAKPHIRSNQLFSGATTTWIPFSELIMAATQTTLLSPAELAYLHASLSLSPPLRPDGRSPTQFRPLSAETDILPGTNGSARICFADGTEAIVGVKAEVEKTRARHGAGNTLRETELIQAGGGDNDNDDDDANNDGEEKREGESAWVEIAVELPGTRDDDANTIYLAEMLSEALLADGEFVKRLWINRRFHWKLYLDVRIAPLSIARYSSYHFANVSCQTDSSHLATTFIPSAPSLTYDTSFTPRDPAASTKIRRRRRPSL